jgi:hypothetical protein
MGIRVPSKVYRQRRFRKLGEMVSWFKKDKPPDYNAEQASRMTPKKILEEIRKGKTVTGFDYEIAEHLGKSSVKDFPVKKLDKEFARKGRLDMDTVIKHRVGKGLVADLRSVLGKQSNNYKNNVPLKDQMHPAAYKALLEKEARRQGLL